MKRLAFVVKGQTFMKAMAPLIIFAARMGVECHIVAYRTRPGKSYDNLDLETIKKLLRKVYLPGFKTPPIRPRVVAVDGDIDAFEYLATVAKVHDVVGQGMHHHYKLLCRAPGIRAYSIAIFTDTLHYAAHHQQKGDVLPLRTYFANEALRQKASELLGHDWPGAVVKGSPMFDHVLFLEPGVKFKDGSVCFLTPPAGMITPELEVELSELAEHVHAIGGEFVVKDRPRFPWKNLTQHMHRVPNKEFGLPYTSMQLLAACDLHVSSYSTSAFEARFLRKPTINLELSDGANPNIGNARVKAYGLNVFCEPLCRTVNSGLVAAYDGLIAEGAGPEKFVTMDDNHSIDIIRDVLRHMP